MTQKNKAERLDPRFAPGARHEGMRARAVGRLVEDALFEADLRALTISIELDADFFHVAVTVLDAAAEDRERAAYDD